ncbi:MAG TPA: biotin transporter BioY [Candidatus Nanoarchaeia archaeon]|nr:biotin transporter BioY [Candidatus Nanoarchaeia archaeon]
MPTSRKNSKKTGQSPKIVSTRKSNDQTNPSLAFKMLIFAALFAALTAAVAPFKIPLPFTPVPITLQTLAVLLSGAMLGPLYGAISMALYLIVGALGLPVFAGGSSGIGAILGPTGGYLLSYPVAAFAVGFLMKGKKTARMAAYGSFALVAGMILLVLSDAILKIGIIKLGGSSMVDLLSPMQYGFLVGIGFFILIGMVLFAMFASRVQVLDSATVFAMFAGTIVIYSLGALGGKIVTGLPWSAILVGWVLPFILGDTIKLFIAAFIAKSVDISRYLR